MNAIRVITNSKVSQVSSRTPSVRSDSNLTDFFIGDNMAQIRLTQGKYAIVDDEYFDRLNGFKWCAHKNRKTYYAVRNSKRQKGRRTFICMHREILGLKTSDGKDTDHINGNGLDNRRVNLRPCTPSQNQHNRRSFCGTSKYKGVSWHKRDKKWQAYIRLNGKLIHLGLFDSEIEAARAYDIKAKELFGEFAHLNFKGDE